MRAPLTSAPKHGRTTFLFTELAADCDALRADIAFLGMRCGPTRSVAEICNGQSAMPAVMRRARGTLP